MQIKAILASLAGIILAGCESSDQYVWREPIDLSPRVQTAYESYKEKVTNKGVFAVSEDGRTYGYSVCPVGAQCRGNAQIIAIRACERHSRGHVCKVYTDRQPKSVD